MCAMKKRIGILTISHSLMNYGNRLQNYALQKTLAKLGYDSETVAYTPSYEGVLRPAGTVKKRSAFVRKFRAAAKRAIISAMAAYRAVVSFGKASTLEAKTAGFNEFIRTKLSWTDEKYTLGSDFSALDRKFDCLIAGSDQIWNPFWEGTQPVYFMEYVPPEKRTVYAASFGVQEIPEEMKEQFRKYLTQIPRISCREDRGCEIVEELTGKRPEHVIDPTFLLNREEWAEIEQRPSGVRIREPYVLVYFLGRITAEARHRIKALKRSGMSVIYLDKVLQVNTCFASPQEFLYLVNHAAAIVTDSFHGTAFAVIFNRPFTYCVSQRGAYMGSRLSSLFKMLGCSENTTDFTEINKAVLREQHKALEYLKAVLP